MSDPKNVGDLVDWLTARPGEPFWFAERGDRLLIGVRTEVGEVLVWNCQIKSRRYVQAAPSPSPSSAPRPGDDAWERIASGARTTDDIVAEVFDKMEGRSDSDPTSPWADLAIALCERSKRLETGRSLRSAAPASPQGERERALREAAEAVESLIDHTRIEDEEQAAWIHAWSRAADRIRALAASSPHYAEKETTR